MTTVTSELEQIMGHEDRESMQRLRSLKPRVFVTLPEPLEPEPLELEPRQSIRESR